MKPEYMTNDTLSPRAQAMLQTLSRHIDCALTFTDIKEENPEFEWDGKIGMTWIQLLAVPQLQDRLLVVGEDSNTYYTLLSEPNDVKRHKAILEEMVSYMEDKDNPAPEVEVKRWRTRLVALGAVTTAVSGGVAVGMIVKSRRKK